MEVTPSADAGLRPGWQISSPGAANTENECQITQRLESLWHCIDLVLKKPATCLGAACANRLCHPNEVIQSEQ